MKTKRIVFPAANMAVIENVEIEGPGPGQILIKSEVSAISAGTEGELLRNSFLGYPLIPGYSLVGVVQKLGSGVVRFAVGDRVCTSGSHAAHFIANADFAVRVPEGVDPESASFFNLAHTALYGLRRSRMEFGDSVLVLGQGVLGLIAARLAYLHGALPLITADVDSVRRDMSRRFGADLVMDSSDPQRLIEALAKISAGGPAIVIEATAAPEPLELAISVVREQGRVVMLTMSPGRHKIDVHDALALKGAELIGGYVNSKPYSLHRTGVSITAWPPELDNRIQPYLGPHAWSSERDIETVLELMARGRLLLKDLITHRFTASQASEAYSLVRDRDRSMVGALIDWRAS